MPRNYAVTFENVTVSAPQDLVQIIGATGKTLRIKRCYMNATNTSLPPAQMYSTRARFLPAVVTNGSGGSAPTPEPFDPGDAAASFTAKTNNTTKATTSTGSGLIQYEGGGYLYAGDYKEFADYRQPVVGPSESWVYELLSTVSGSVTMSGGVEVEETGG